MSKLLKAENNYKEDKSKKAFKGCKVPGCSHPHEAQGYCNGHYIQMRKFGRIKRAVLMRDANTFIPDISEGTCEIVLRDIQGQIVGGAIIDVEDMKKCSNTKWHLGMNGYAQNIRKDIKLQQVILGKEGLIDHKNRNRLDCRKENLRKCNVYQNAQNRSITDKNTSGYIGVCWHKRAKKWMSYISSHGKKTYLGLFTNIEKAARKRDVAALSMFGEFAVLNFNKKEV